jgi:hypothetical protein
MLAERWSGATWSIQSTLKFGGPGQGRLDGVSCSRRRACTAVGWYDDYGLTLGARWTGVSWSVQATPDPGNSQNVLAGVSCPSRGICIAVGGTAKKTGALGTLAERWRAG